MPLFRLTSQHTGQTRAFELLDILNTLGEATNDEIRFSDGNKEDVYRLSSFIAVNALEGLESLFIQNQNIVLQQADAWIRNLKATNLYGTYRTGDIDTAYGVAQVTSTAVYNPALRVLQGQIPSNGHLQEWTQAGKTLSLMATQAPVFLEGGNYISSTANYQGFLLGPGIGSHGSTGCSMSKGALIFHTDESDYTLSATGSDQAWCNLNNSSAFQVDKNDRIFFKGTAIAPSTPIDYLLGINALTGQAIKTRSVSKPGMPTATADPSGEEGEIRHDDNFIALKTTSGWKRAGLSNF